MTWRAAPARPHPARQAHALAVRAVVLALHEALVAQERPLVDVVDDEVGAQQAQVLHAGAQLAFESKT